MHENEVVLAISNLQQMINQQFPQWSHLNLQLLNSAGTVNIIYRLGDDFSIRLPRVLSGVDQIEKEKIWLPRLSKTLPLKIPKPITIGQSSIHYPWTWAVYEWIEGENAIKERLIDLPHNAKILAEFIIALQKIDSRKGPKPGAHNYHRGEPLQNRDQMTREIFFKLKKLGLINLQFAEKVWDDALSAPLQDQEISWIHGDLQSGNILAKEGSINTVIDFGALGVGDSACDIMPAWNLFDSKSRDTFLSRLSATERLIKRARGWAISVAAIALEYYIKTNITLAEISKYTIQEIEKEA